MELSNDLTTALHILTEDGVAQEYETQLTEILLGQGKDSVINCCGEGGRAEVEGQLIGPISVLTFVDALKKTGNKYAENLDITKITAPSDLDARNKVDLVLDFGTKTEGKRPVVRLIQLKTTREPAFYVEKYNPAFERDPILEEKVPSWDIKKMEDYADQLKRRGVHPIIYIVGVPAYDTVCVNNVFGIVQPGFMKKDKYKGMVDKFCEDVTRTGLLPKG